MTEKILIIGATGNIGYEVAKQMYSERAPIYAALRSSESVAKLPQPDIPWVLFDFENPTTHAPALNSVSKLFLMRPPHITEVEKLINPVIDTAMQVGIKQITFLSISGAEKMGYIPHAKVETYLREVNAPYTFIRAGFFNQNLSGTHLADIRNRDDIFIPAGKGKTAFIDARDIAAVIVKTLTEDGHQGKAYTLTGLEAYDMYEVAEIMSTVLGRPIRYSNPFPLRFLWQLHRRGYSWGYSAMVTMIYMTTHFGQAELITHEVEEVLGRPPITFEQYVEEYADVWR